MSLFDDASLAMIPSAYKDGKLYSIKPTDGSGDFTFTRGSNLAATRVDENGLIEKGRENLLLQSNQFDTTWTTSSSSITGGQSGYNGGSNAWLLQATASTSTARLEQAISLTGVHTTSIYAKAGSTDWIAIQMWSNHFAYFDVANGVVGNSGSVIDASIEAAGNGFYRCSISYNASSVGNLWVYVIDGNGSTSVTSGKNVYLQSAQLERGLVATDYIETTTTTAQAGILEDMPRLDYSGGASCPSLLLEPQRSNLITNSEYINSSVSGWSKFFETTITNNDAISPEGLQNATKLSCPIGGSFRLDAIVPNLAAATYTFSFYAKGNITNLDVNIYQDATGATLSSTPIETLISDSEWNRIEITFTSTALSTIRFIFTGLPSGEFFYMWGAQLESNASYPTSYIPTYGTSQTRSDDFMNISSLADEIDGNSFTYFLEINNEAVVRDSATGNISVGASGNRFFLYNDSSATARMKLYIQDVTTQSYQLSADNVKLVVRIEPNKVEVFENGVSVLSTTQNLDFSGNSSYVLRGATREMGIKQTAIFPTPLTDSECIALTTL
jgi:hypothetical protein